MPQLPWPLLTRISLPADSRPFLQIETISSTKGAAIMRLVVSTRNERGSISVDESRCKECVVAPRAYWKGYLKLSLVSCPVALFPATSEREKISFHQLNKNTGPPIKYRKVDAETDDEVESADIVKGYQVGKDDYLLLEPEELEAIALESKRVIEIDEFVPRKE